MIELAAGDMRLRLDPETGGAVAAWTFRGTELLRPVVDHRLQAQHGRPVAAYPLLPFANRVGWCRFEWGGRLYRLEHNFGDHPHAIHGNGWMRSWTVAESGPDAARLRFSHAPPADPPAQWPFRFSCEQSFRLASDGLAVGFRLVNEDALAWPAGLGLHPYVAREPDTSVAFQAASVWLTGPDSLPSRRVPAEGVRDFSAGRRADEAEIDACFAGWDGRARVSWPSRGLALEIEAGPPFGHLQLYTPRGQDFLGLEPVSNMPDAINRVGPVPLGQVPLGQVPDQGLRVLAPGEALAGVVRLRPVPL
jgi:aldose 1-epimerase